MNEMNKDDSGNKSFIKVSIVDDDIFYKDYLKNILLQDKRIHLFSDYSSSFDFLNSLDSPFQPDVVLMDILLDKLSGIECGTLLKKRYPKVHIVLMTSFPSGETIVQAKDLEADYIEKGHRVEELLNKIIISVINSKRERFISLQISDHLDLDCLGLALQIKQAKNRLNKLSKTQTKILDLKIAGKSEHEIASILNIHRGTVSTHIRRALKRLDLPNLLEYILE